MRQHLSDKHFLRSAISEALSTIRIDDVFVAIRIDDIGEEKAHARELISSLVNRAISVNLQVIPSQLNSDSAAWVNSLGLVYPGLVEVNQHGWRHVNHETGGNKQEFGPSRSFRQKLDDIREGWEAITEHLTVDRFQLFSPPWNRVDGEGLTACQQLGFRAISTFGAVKGLPTAMTDLSANVDFDVVAGAGPYSAAIGLTQVWHQLRAWGRAIIMVHPTELTSRHLPSLIEVLLSLRAGGLKASLFSEVVERRQHTIHEREQAS